MAELTRAHGNAAPFEAVGRDIEWVLINVDTWDSGDYTTTPEDPDSNLESVVRAMSEFGTITIQGLADANNLILGMEGFGGAGAADRTALLIAIDVALTALSTVTSVTITDIIIDGATFT